MLDSRTATDRAPSPEAIEFVRFCYRRRRVGWPELYDEMCGVAGRGLYRGWGSDELSAQGIGFSLFELPALAALVGQIVAEDQERRTSPAASGVRIVAVTAASDSGTAATDPVPADEAASVGTTSVPQAPTDDRPSPAPRAAAVPATVDQPIATDLRFTRASAPAGA